MPGKTTSAEAWDILTDLEFIDHDLYPFRGHGGQEGLEWINWRTLAHDDPAKLGYFYAREGVVTEVHVALDFEPTLQQVLDKYGAPEKLLSFQRGVEMPQNYIHFYYPKQGLIFVSWSDPVPYVEKGILSMGELTPDTPITEVYYFEPTSMDRLFDALPEYARRLPYGEEHLLDWQGMGPIEVLP